MFGLFRALSIALVLGIYSSCHTLDRKAAESSLLVAHVIIPGYPSDKVTGWTDLRKYKWALFRRPLPVPTLYVIRTTDDKSLPIRSERFQNGIFIFPNVTPGEYRIYDLIVPRVDRDNDITLEPDEFGRQLFRIYDLIAPGGNRGNDTTLEPDEFGRRIFIQDAHILWTDDSARISQTEALAGVGNYMGTFHLPIPFDDVPQLRSTRNAQSERLAMQSIVDGWSGEWSDLVRLQLAGAY